MATRPMTTPVEVTLEGVSTPVAPPAPTHQLSVTESITRGREQWKRAWARFARQFTQPQLLKLSRLTLGKEVFWSSQISGWKSGKLKDPSPKLLLAFGRLNQAIAYANGWRPVDPHQPVARVPGTEPALWRGKTWITGPDGEALGPAEVFLAVAGVLDLRLAEGIELPESVERPLANQLGRQLRLAMGAAGIDWMTDLPDEVAGNAALLHLIHSEPISGEELTAALQPLAKLLEVDPDGLLRYLRWAIEQLDVYEQQILQTAAAWLEDRREEAAARG